MSTKLFRWVVLPIVAIIAAVAVAAQMDNNNPSTTLVDRASITAPPAGDLDLQLTPPSDSDEITGLKAAPEVKGTGKLPNQGITKRTQGAWGITEFKHLATNPIVKDFMSKLQNPAPNKWKTFPNVKNPDLPSSEFRVVQCADNPANTCVPDGAEYGMADAPFCEHPSLRCDIVVPARSYRLVSGDYGLFDLVCKGENRKGCAYLLVNVSDETVTLRDQSVDNGFTVHGRYWNGDMLHKAIWGLVSHTAANMLGMPTIRNAVTGDVLNAGGSDDANAGANCGRFNACQQVEFTVIVLNAQPAALEMARTVITTQGAAALN